MESDDDYESFSLPIEPSPSPINQPKKLKRLKKKTSIDSNVPVSVPIDHTIPSSSSLNTVDISPISNPDISETIQVVDSVPIVNESENSELEELFFYKERSEENRISMMDWEEEDRFGELDEKVGEEKKGGKKRGSLKEGDEEEGEQKKKRRKSKGKAEKSVRVTKKMEKERKVHLKELHAESQRLLEEGDMPFANEDSNGVDTRNVESASKPASLPSPNKPILSNMPLDEESKCVFRAPINDTQDLSDGFQTSDEEDLEDSEEDSPVEEVLAPSVLTMNLKLDSAPPDDMYDSEEPFDILILFSLLCMDNGTGNVDCFCSSDEEDYDKENIDPHPCKVSEEEVYPKGDPVKAFVDDEAEEEDDSDNDLMRFKENEEDEENEESEEFNDLIVSGYKEKPMDNAKRDQLHQMWLEQQDAAATDNVLQRLKCGGNQLREPIALEEEEGDDEKEADGEDFDKDSMDDASCDLLPQNVARMNSKKAKQMMSQMFTDKDDVFLSSDDEETEQKLVRIRLLEKAEEHTSFLSPAEDENSREVFGLIKKLNIAPDSKKKAKSSSFFDKLVTGGNSNSSLKSSFLGRARNSSLPSSKKTGSSSFKSFIFGRDDSNSRSAITTSEVSSNSGDSTKRPTKTASAKFSNSQSNFSSQRTSQTSSSSSLLEILRRSNKSDHSVRNHPSGQTEVAVQFAAFKSVKRSMKVEART
ncbi:hypothetical protein IFM89_032435 [Coptis chinensis]|uniref:Uncharacterized protein n=1 Tax=Coptis chinensis TaxID=261450 RepID=A0A835I2K8_9MAGN|nr:hypothetical protein IFM89_032435 [Coptis chinensis]